MFDINININLHKINTLNDALFLSLYGCLTVHPFIGLSRHELGPLTSELDLKNLVAPMSFKAVSIPIGATAGFSVMREQSVTFTTKK